MAHYQTEMWPVVALEPASVTGQLQVSDPPASWLTLTVLYPLLLLSFISYLAHSTMKCPAPSWQAVLRASACS